MVLLAEIRAQRYRIMRNHCKKFLKQLRRAQTFVKYRGYLTVIADTSHFDALEDLFGPISYLSADNGYIWHISMAEWNRIQPAVLFRKISLNNFNAQCHTAFIVVFEIAA